MKKLLILGASGLIGKALSEECKGGYEIYGTSSSSVLNIPAANQYRIQINEIDKMKDLVQSIKPDAIISCLRGDFDQQLIFHRELALELKNTESKLYYFSTANVFDGDFSQYHSEIDKPNATSSYGKFKIDCESMLQEILKKRAVILRIPQIWGRQSPRMESIKTGIENNQVAVYSNLECNNLSDTTLAKQVNYIVENKLTGIFHLGSVDMMSHELFIKKLVKGLTSKELYFAPNLFQQTNEICYFGLESYRNDLPKFLHQTNAELISELIG